MDVHLRCGQHIGTICLRCHTADEVRDVKARLTDGASSGPDLLFTHAGRPCPDGATLASLGMIPGSRYIVDVLLRLRGGGGDGGSTGAESRASYLEMYATKKPDKVNPEEEVLARWTTCRLSGDRLASPVCADELGNLYNKSAVVAALVAKSLPQSHAHITSLRHLIDLKPERSSTAKGRAGAGANGVSAGDFQMNNGADFQCPLTGLPMNGRYRFFAFRSSGLVVSEKALKEVPAAVEELAGGKWAPEDLLPLNGSAQEVAGLRERMLLAHAAAKRKKDKRKAGASVGAAEELGVSGTSAAAAPAASPAAPGHGLPGSHQRGMHAAHESSAQELARAKKFKATEAAPAHASKEVWASIFTSSRPEAKETYGCRALSSRGLA